MSADIFATKLDLNFDKQYGLKNGKGDKIKTVVAKERGSTPIL